MAFGWRCGGGAGELGSWVAGDVWCVRVRRVCSVKEWDGVGGSGVCAVVCEGGDGGGVGESEECGGPGSSGQNGLGSGTLHCRGST